MGEHQIFQRESGGHDSTFRETAWVVPGFTKFAKIELGLVFWAC